ncbi:RAD55 family ATPase [Haloprofundus salilacus]|uniref:RAD55 family ATPase n=1 Tax=Haloprofundus salilacus TaxID=2876190 RepID=UPI001CCAC55C|nr:HTR-like protein [Haloprofundus salilacus]
MENIPFGVSRFDSVIGGGAPPGNVVLLSGESGAGAREFLQTSAAMNGLAHADDDLFELYYGALGGNTRLPEEVHYLSFTTDEEYIGREMAYTMADDIVDAALSKIRFRDFSAEYFQLSPIPREWYVGETSTIRDLGKQHSREDVLSALGEYLGEHAPGNLVLVDSITDLVGAISENMSWSDIAMVMKGLRKAAHQWGGLIILLVNEETLGPQELGLLTDAAGGTLRFRWESGGSKRARTMVVEEFRGVLSRIEGENIVRFEVEIAESGLDVSDVRKIR